MLQSSLPNFLSATSDPSNWSKTSYLSGFIRNFVVWCQICFPAKSVSLRQRLKKKVKEKKLLPIRVASDNTKKSYIFRLNHILFNIHTGKMLLSYKCGVHKNKHLHNTDHFVVLLILKIVEGINKTQTFRISMYMCTWLKIKLTYIIFKNHLNPNKCIWEVFIYFYASCILNRLHENVR